MSRDFESKLNPMINYITKCKPLNTVMGHAINNIKTKISKLDPGLKEEEVKFNTKKSVKKF
jgi:translation initiation factor 2B subunit (eIF-2B alpha/beta/delta family)